MAKHVPFTGTEKDSLTVSLDRHREAVIWKLEGLDDTTSYAKLRFMMRGHTLATGELIALYASPSA